VRLGGAQVAKASAAALSEATVRPARLPLDRHLLTDLRLRQLREDSDARSWGGLRREAELDVDALLGTEARR